MKFLLLLLIFSFVSCEKNEEQIFLFDDNKSNVYSAEASLSLYLKSQSLMKQQKYKEAEKSYEKLLNIEPDFSKAWEGLAESKIMQGDFEISIEYLNKAIILNSNIATHHSIRALVNYYLNLFDQATKDAILANSIDPKDTLALIVLGAIKSFEGDMVTSNNYYEEAIQISPDDSSIFFWRAKSLRFNEMYENSLKDFNKAIIMDRSRASYFYERAVLYIQINELDKAKSDLEEAIEISKNPRNSLMLEKSRLLLNSLNNE